MALVFHAEQSVYAQKYAMSGYEVGVFVHMDDSALRKVFEELTGQDVGDLLLHGFCRSCVPKGSPKPAKGIQVHFSAPVPVAVVAHEISHAVHHAYWSRSRKRVFPSPHSEIEEKIATDIGELVGEVWTDLKVADLAAF